MEPAVLRFCERALARTLSGAVAALVRHASRGVIVVNSAMRVVSANQSALTLFRKKRGLRAAVVQHCRRMNEERLNLLRTDSVTGVRADRCERSIDESSGAMKITMFCHDPEGLSDPSFLVEIDAADRRTQKIDPVTVASGLSGLTRAEQDVVVALTGGHSNQEIADRLGKSVPAVKFLLHRIYTKTGVSNRTALVAALKALPNESAKALTRPSQVPIQR
jgi:DNA-binding CsgD family transcriptional regulator